MRQIGERDGFGRVHQPTDAAQFEQVAQQKGHLVGGTSDPIHVAFHLIDVARDGVLLQQAEEAFDGHQRRFEVVRDRVGEAFEFIILAFEFIILAFE